MYEKALCDVQRKLVRLMRTDPPIRAARVDPATLPLLLDRWIAARFSADELDVLFRHEHLYGEEALSAWFAEALVQAGLVEAPRLAS